MGNPILGTDNKSTHANRSIGIWWRTHDSSISLAHGQKLLVPSKAPSRVEVFPVSVYVEIDLMKR